MTREWIEGAPIRRPMVSTECFRRAYREAKRIYKGLPATSLVPEEESRNETSFQAKVVDATRKYYDQQ